MTAHSGHTIAIVLVSMMVVGCAQDGTLLTGSLNTSSIDQPQTASTARGNPLCATLASQIDALNKEGIPDKVSKAAAKKYKLKNADLAKADELNKANSEFQTKCSEYPPSPTVAAAVPEEPPKKAAAKATPPVPAPKPVASALPPENTGTVAQSAPPAPFPGTN